MSLRIREICKEKGITTGELAKKLNITSVSLCQCLSAGNPSYKRLQEFADALEVDIAELFEKPTSMIQGCVFIGGEPHVIKSKADLKSLMDIIE